ncbi:unnamed protein product [Polarella glacialis]|uniref:Uncharacterized protein n=1 Tax=Polarella glacialis TaxID=89957 RepID=A0A813EFA0_POLGL|nr:unnamed protein product [Polarella glacialis]
MSFMVSTSYRLNLAMQALDAEKSERCQECQELRAILDSVWKRATCGSAASCSKNDEEFTKKSYYFKYADPEGRGDEFKELVGDAEDINTLYEMVREALGDTVNLRQQIADEHASRTRETSTSRHQLDQMSRQLNTVQALLREVTQSAGAEGMKGTHASGGTPGASNRLRRGKLSASDGEAECPWREEAESSRPDS